MLVKTVDTTRHAEQGVLDAESRTGSDQSLSDGAREAEAGREEEFILLRRCGQGDEAAFSELYRRYARKLLGYVYGHVKDWQETEDIVQEIFVQILKDAESYEPRAAISTWLFRIAMYMCLKWKRNHGIRGRIMAREIANGTFVRPAYASDVGEALSRKEATAAAEELTDALPPDQKAVFVLREYHNLSYEEIARILCMRLGTVKSSLSRTRGRLREGLGRKGFL